MTAARPSPPERPTSEPRYTPGVIRFEPEHRRRIMGLGRGALLWLVGVPLPIIILLALFWR